MPSFEEWTTCIEQFAFLDPRLRKLSLMEQTRLAARKTMQRHRLGAAGEMDTLNDLLQLGEELAWCLDGRPYYKIHPHIVEHLCRCELGKIPLGFLEVPGGLSAILLRFAEPSPLLSLDENRSVKAILLSNAMQYLPPDELCGFLTGFTPHSKIKGRNKCITLRINFGEQFQRDGVNYTQFVTYPLRRSMDISLQDECDFQSSALSESLHEDGQRAEVFASCLRLIATVGFIATSPQDSLLQFDVLAKDRQRYETASEEVRQSLIDRARRRGKHGWNVGTDEMFVPDVPKWTESSKTGQSGQHSHAHIRTGHLHSVRCGPGKKDIKIKWFRPTVVRPDLPFVASAHGVSK